MIIFSKLQKSEVKIDRKIPITVSPIKVIFFNQKLIPILSTVLFPSTSTSNKTYSISQTQDSYIITLHSPAEASYVAINFPSLLPIPECVSDWMKICDYLKELFSSKDLQRVYEKYKDIIIPSFPSDWIGREINGYKIIDIIGEGGNSYVLKGIKDSKLFAIKVPKISNQLTATISSFNLFKEFFNEAWNIIEISSKSDYLVKVYGINVDFYDIKEIMRGDLLVYLTKPPTLVMEYVEGGSVLSLLSKGFNFSSNWERIVAKIGLDIAYALKTLHISGYVHLDIKPSNFLLSRNVNSPEEICNIKVKLSDLGSVKRIRQTPTHFTAEYAPPELYMAYPAMPAMDVFSLGASLFALTWGRSGFNPDEIVFSNDSNTVYQRYVNFYTKLYYSSLTKFQRYLLSLVYPDYRKRPSIIQVIEGLKRFSC
ncbi:protein kinase [Sulfurisphaera javensis]|uniref:Protein kinase n=1 Tax=Sulfurisphaera javensis TaxID=2049879 RepID=A0AAT9GVJ2_9CREN